MNEINLQPWRDAFGRRRLWSVKTIRRDENADLIGPWPQTGVIPQDPADEQVTPVMQTCKCCSNNAEMMAYLENEVAFLRTYSHGEGHATKS